MFHDIEQNTDEWLNLRAGKITGSGISKIMAKFGQAFGDPAKKYAVQIAIEQITGSPSGSGYSNEHMERGHEQEPLARMLYEEEYFCTVSNGGFFDLGDLGCSPDGLVNNDGLLEIKSVIASTHYERIRKQSYDTTYKWQLASNLKMTGRDWIDFISYCQDFPEGKQIFVHRLRKDDFKEEFEMMDERIPQFINIVKEAKERILRSNYSLLDRSSA
jgi:hypothetical protein